MIDIKIENPIDMKAKSNIKTQYEYIQKFMIQIKSYQIHFRLTPSTPV